MPRGRHLRLRRKLRPRNKRHHRTGLSQALRLNALTGKTYSYQFNLAPQIMKASQITGTNPVNFSGAPNGVVPITSLLINPSITGFSGFYDVGLACPFALSDIGNIGPWRQMYDAYRINSISLTIEYLNNSSSVNSSGLMPTIWLYQDQDDANVPTALTALTGKQGVKMFQFGDKARTKYTFKLTPTLQTVVTTAAGANSVVVNKKPVWCNTSPSTPGYASATHFGLKMYITDFYAPQVANICNAFRFNWKYNVSFRSPTTAF